MWQIQISENWNIVADNRDNFSSDIIKTSIFLQKFQLVIVGAGQLSYECFYFS